MSQNSTLHDAFQDERVHEVWESAYRGNRLLDRFNDVLMDRLLRYLDQPKGARILDAGCGIGDHTLRFARRGFHCTGVDISEPMLDRARERARVEGLEQRVEYTCCGLEKLSFSSGQFDAVHCRGVLMHILRWADALKELCRVLAPNGTIVVIESNASSLEAGIVRVVRMLRKSKSQIIKTPAGIEFHWSEPGQAPLARIANIPFLTKTLQDCGVEPLTRFATEFWDVARFPQGVIRNSTVLFNRAWFGAHLPAFPSCGNALIGRKTTKDPNE
ncbi:MAG: class I SAM-dependent methyltransferase [Planctomycetaceae bacterium]|nr:class I SAM-dependent methyltransferase [Planctomycetaceae bacterium]